ncbi:exodeoxyribonuclease III [Candidatus Woesearchaeota archaeon]|nr:exodeoxyribonuclease III [Candidatus Woesearchaeota archaeon]
MKLISWNVNGIRAAMKKGFAESIHKVNPDVLCLQETKAHQDDVDAMMHGYHHIWNSAEKKGYAGTAVFSKVKPLTVAYGIGIAEHDKEGRVITLEYDDFYVVNAYVPNSKRGLFRLPYRKTWDHEFTQYLKKLDAQKPVIVCGDLNVAHTPLDIANPAPNYNKTAGFTQQEIDGFSHLLSQGFIDTFREFNKAPGQYTWWGMWNNLRARNIGWRIDYFLISKRLRPRLHSAFILPYIMGSDHCPVGIEIQN